MPSEILLCYLPVAANAGMSLGIFVMQPGHQMPIHDHPGMTVFSKMLYGTIRYRAFDWVDEEPPKGVVNDADRTLPHVVDHVDHVPSLAGVRCPGQLSRLPAVSRPTSVTPSRHFHPLCFSLLPCFVSSLRRGASFPPAQRRKLQHGRRMC